MGGAVILMAVLTGVYGCVWNGYFNKLIEFPFWRRGNWLMIALYAGILFFFLYTYGGFRIGYLKKGNLLCSQILSIGLLNIITYIQISLLDKKFHDPRILLAMQGNPADIASMSETGNPSRNEEITKASAA